MQRHGELMAAVIRLFQAAYPEVPAQMRMGKLEEVLRAHHPGRAAPHLDPTNLSFFENIPHDQQEVLRNTMTEGVRTGIPRGESNASAKSTETALDNEEDVNGNCRKFALNAWIRVIPPQSREETKDWEIDARPVHYVPGQDRMVAHLSAAMGKPGRDPNSRSPEFEHYGTVQADYIDRIAEEIAKYFTELTGLEKESYVALKGDIKSAFMCIPVHTDDVGSLAMEWQGWLFVFCRTPFGWRWATHTFSPFTRVIKHKVCNHKRHGILGWQLGSDR